MFSVRRTVWFLKLKFIKLIHFHNYKYMLIGCLMLFFNNDYPRIPMRFLSSSDHFDHHDTNITIRKYIKNKIWF